MIKEIDQLMVHWGEQRRRYGLGAGIGSQMGTIMDWKGSAPRGVPGTRILSGGLGMDRAASVIEFEIAALERSGMAEQELAKLARLKYCHEASMREQMRELGISEGADRTYRNWVSRLHTKVQRSLVGKFDSQTPTTTACKHVGASTNICSSGGKPADFGLSQ